MRWVAAVAVLAIVTACGADGPPVAPAAKSGDLAISGEIVMGIASEGGK